MPFTLVQLETFRKLAELGNFSRAAAALHVTQPAVTQQVQALQERGGRFFARPARFAARFGSAVVPGIHSGRQGMVTGPHGTRSKLHRGNRPAGSDCLV